MTARRLAMVQFAFATGILAYWGAFFGLGAGAFAGAVDARAFLAFESSFPVPDGCLALALVASGALLLRGDQRGIALTLVTSGALLFLGAVDLSFNLSQGAFSGDATHAAVSALVNATCIGGGASMALAANRASRNRATWCMSDPHWGRIRCHVSRRLHHSS